MYVKYISVIIECIYVIRHLYISDAFQIHFSFSLAGSIESGTLPPALSVMIQSVGVTLTDVHDIIFRYLLTFLFPVKYMYEGICQTTQVPLQVIVLRKKMHFFNS